jgi:hypothetical protein
MAAILDHRRNPNAMLAGPIVTRLGVSTGGLCYGIVSLEVDATPRSAR